MKYLAIDYGQKRTGLAVCDPDERIASPLAVLQGRKRLAERIAEIVRAEQIDAVVVGLPLNMDGSRGPQARKVMDFASELGKVLEIPIAFEDERLSSFEAGQRLAGTGLSRSGKARRIDAVAAAHILESFLERRKRR